jgi:hypothetical protein
MKKMEERKKIREELETLNDLSPLKSGNSGFEVSEQKLMQLAEKALVYHKQQQIKVSGWRRFGIAAALTVLLSVALWFNFSSEGHSHMMADNGYSDLYFDYLSEEAMSIEDGELIEVLGELFLLSIDDQINEHFSEEF